MKRFINSSKLTSWATKILRGKRRIMELEKDKIYTIALLDSTSNEKKYHDPIYPASEIL